MMIKIINLVFYPILLTALISYFISPLVIKFAKRLGIIDDPSKNKHPKVIHTHPTPRGGGIPIFISILFASLFFIPLDKHLVSILAGAFLIFVMGFLDDKYNLNPYVRIAIGFLAASIPIISGIGISFLTNPLGGIIDLSNPLISDLFALVWIVFMMNMLNMGAKGVDGQLSGVTVISALTITALSFYYSAEITVAIILLTSITAGAFFYLGINFLKNYAWIWRSTLQDICHCSILSTTKVGTLIVVWVYHLLILATQYLVVS
jgi:UDP-GlcNAc:undecaprenyl-phosphate GlcNAc-1-phosphate transferase